MGFLDFLTGGGKPIFCPECGTKGAQKADSGRIRCPNSNCTNFDPSMQVISALGNLAGSGGSTSPSTPQGRAASGRGGFSPARPLTIQYSNFKGETKTFTGDADTAERKNNHISVRVMPTGARLSLSRDRIQNLAEVESALPQRVAPGQAWPTARERQVMGYHKKHGTTSPLYEQIRAKYPNW